MLLMPLGSLWSAKYPAVWFGRGESSNAGHRILAGYSIIWGLGEGGLVVNDKKTKNSGVMIVAFAAVAGWQIYDMATATETPSRALAVLQYVLLAGLLIGFIGAVLNFLRSQ
jgi:bacteriorhodopsin